MNNINKYIVITGLFPTEKNFRAPYILDQVRAITKNGNLRVIVFKPKKWFEKEVDYEFEGVKIYRFNTFNLPSYVFPNLFSKLSELSLFLKFKKLGIDTNTIKYAHAHGTSYGYLVNAIKSKNPKTQTILQHHGFDVLNLTLGVLSKFKWYNKYIEKYGIKICNKIDIHVGVSKKTLEYLKSFKNIIINREYVLYNGVDLSKFYAVKNIKENDVFVIGCVANFWPLKDQITLLKAINEVVKKGVTKLKVIFIGSGETLADCKKFVHSNYLEEIVEFRKEVLHCQLNDFYNELDLFVLPSYHEAFGCVYTEAYACGVPFIGVHEQGISELIPDSEKNKWLIGKSDVDQLSKLIIDYITNMPNQTLAIDINIDNLVDKFLCEISIL
ncbi:glycosyltransferase family 4 protein [uncultured Gelidibacter sp.]|uniref:glycosyltransferase family 4 protein n=1 Tax=uncultured Gelidibacter sp. TaxID=259318 RepID=UPI00260AC7DE|nr:glycosyltransferase family 4 protein [uncultured Gelidibacter sp.]